MKSKNSLFNKSEKPISIKLVGHTDSIRAIDSSGDFVMTGGQDFMVKLWDLKAKKAHTFSDHMGWVTHLKILDNYLVSGGNDKHIRV